MYQFNTCFLLIFEHQSRFFFIYSSSSFESLSMFFRSSNNNDSSICEIGLWQHFIRTVIFRFGFKELNDSIYLPNYVLFYTSIFSNDFIINYCTSLHADGIAYNESEMMCFETDFAIVYLVHVNAHNKERLQTTKHVHYKRFQ